MPLIPAIKKGFKMKLKMVTHYYSNDTEFRYYCHKVEIFKDDKLIKRYSGHHCNMDITMAKEFIQGFKDAFRIMKKPLDVCKVLSVQFRLGLP